MKKKLYILLVLCLLSAILAGCIAADASKGGELSGESVIEGHKETASDEVSEDDAGSGEMTESVASKGEPSDEPIEDEPSEDEPSDEPIEDEPSEDEPSDEPIEDEPSEDEPSDEPNEDEPSEDELVANTVHDWDAQKGWPLYVGEYVDTGEEWLWPYGDGYWFNTTGAFAAIGEELLYHVRIPAYLLDTNEGDFDKMTELVQSLDIPFKTVANDRGTEDIHFNLSRDDAIRLTEYMTEAGFEAINGKYQEQVIHVCFCGDHLGAEHTVSPEIPENWADLAWKLFQQSEDYWSRMNTEHDWDFQKGWPVFVFREEDLEHFRLRTWPAMEFPYGSAEWNYVAKAFDGEEILIHAKLFADEKQKAFIQYLGIPYETVASDADCVHLDLSYTDAVKLIELMHKAGLCEERHDFFDLCFCEDLNGKNNTTSPKLPEDVDYMN